jgi:hypothetical protein
VTPTDEVIPRLAIWLRVPLPALTAAAPMSMPHEP